MTNGLSATTPVVVMRERWRIAIVGERRVCCVILAPPPPHPHTLNIPVHSVIFTPKQRQSVGVESRGGERVIVSKYDVYGHYIKE